MQTDGGDARRYGRGFAFAFLSKFHATKQQKHSLRFPPRSRHGLNPVDHAPDAKLPNSLSLLLSLHKHIHRRIHLVHIPRQQVKVRPKVADERHILRPRQMLLAQIDPRDQILAIDALAVEECVERDVQLPGPKRS